MQKRQAVKYSFLILAFLLMLLPIILVFNDILTKFVERFTLYTFLQNWVIPYQVKLVGLFLKPLGLSYIPIRNGMIVNNIELHMNWNCLGWQSLLLFFVSAVFALWDSSFTRMSKIEALVLGIFGIFWMNIFRITLVVLLAVYAMPIYQFVFHDILAAVLTILFLMVFWGFCYNYLLEKKDLRRNDKSNAIK